MKAKFQPLVLQDLMLTSAYARLMQDAGSIGERDASEQDNTTADEKDRQSEQDGAMEYTAKKDDKERFRLTKTSRGPVALLGLK